MATDAGLDLVEISPNSSPPVCKIMDFGKYKYEQQKKEAEARKKQKTIEVKEIKFRPNTDTHDYEIKMRSVKKFLENPINLEILAVLGQKSSIWSENLPPNRYSKSIRGHHPYFFEFWLGSRAEGPKLFSRVEKSNF